ncbi:MAG: hypothetical protein ACRDRK_20740 [Pseudonocardia sp.]
MSEPGGELVVYRSDDGRTRVQLRAVAGTVWLAQTQIAELHDTSVSNVAHIVRRVLDDGEVSQATIDSESRVQVEGPRTVRRDVKVYNLDMVSPSVTACSPRRSTWVSRPRAPIRLRGCQAAHPPGKRAVTVADVDDRHRTIRRAFTGEGKTCLPPLTAH